MNNLTALLGIFLVLSILTLHGQEIDQQSYSIIPTPFSNATSIAATKAEVLIATSDGKTFLSSDAKTWRQVATGQTAPTRLCEHNNIIYGISSSGLVKWLGEEWAVIQLSTGSLKSQAGMLYNYGLNANGSLFVRRSADAITWQSLPSYPSFVANVGNLFDLSATESKVVVSGHSGRFIVYPVGETWQLKYVGVSDRLYSSAFYLDSLIFGGTSSMYISSDMNTFTRIGITRGILHLNIFGGIVIGSGGFNPDRGKLVYSNNLSNWVELVGDPIPSMFASIVFKDRLLFLGSTSGISSLVTASYARPSISIESNNSQVIITIKRLGIAVYGLQDSTDLVTWFEVENVSRLDDEQEIRWTVDKESTQKFYRVIVR